MPESRGRAGVATGGTGTELEQGGARGSEYAGTKLESGERLQGPIHLKGLLKS